MSAQNQTNLEKYECTLEERKALSTFVKLVRATESSAARIHQYLAETGLTGTQFGILEALYSLGPLCQKELADKILKTSGNVTQVIDQLEKQGLVQRVRSSEDRRYITVSLTEDGHDLIHKIFPRHAHAVMEEFQILTSAEQDELGRLCRKLGKQ